MHYVLVGSRGLGVFAPRTELVLAVNMVTSSAGGLWVIVAFVGHCEREIGLVLPIGSVEISGS